MRVDIEAQDVLDGLLDVTELLGNGAQIIMQQVAQETRAVILNALERGLYQTEPGDYDRTGELMDGVQVEPVHGQNPGISISNVTKYAHFIEYGVLDGFGAAGYGVDDIPGFNEKSRNFPRFNHSGAGEWWQPVPHIRPGAAWAAWKIEDMLYNAIKRIY